MSDRTEEARLELARIVGRDRADQMLDAYAAGVLRGAARKLRDRLFPATYADAGQRTAEGVNRAAADLDEQALEAYPYTRPNQPTEAGR
ncbi:hypothetical protein OG795_15340 [[Kitasatospora] papulosa]|uniref:hypothetical protein n=1 Tax=[Kitasatospora] papulosa TaxID=1464011 RepID=UPI00324C5E1C